MYATKPQRRRGGVSCKSVTPPLSFLDLAYYLIGGRSRLLPVRAADLVDWTQALEEINLILVSRECVVTGIFDKRVPPDAVLCERSGPGFVSVRSLPGERRQVTLLRI
ncbi:unnamed protein product [Pleuronectes platessa]|uniref:Uncharacterized protein n=1 Tax=Pleuronectes platessa TaxID=8262 RepID=A0A9N7URR2_PLEPL|nr:unnamed protein product [Pleuronectes platessa]